VLQKKKKKKNQTKNTSKGVTLKAIGKAIAGKGWATQS
jgi:hypothetical protein